METIKAIWIELSNHSRYQSLSVIIVLLFIVSFWGCQPKCKSVMKPEQTITRAELMAEIDQINGLVAARVSDLDDQDALRKYLSQATMQIAASGTVDPWMILGSVSTLLLGGAGVDNLRKRTVIKNLEANPAATGPNA